MDHKTKQLIKWGTIILWTLGLIFSTYMFITKFTCTKDSTLSYPPKCANNSIELANWNISENEKFTLLGAVVVTELVLTICCIGTLICIDHYPPRYVLVREA